MKKIKTVNFKKALEAAQKGKYIRVYGPEIYKTDCDWLKLDRLYDGSDQYFFKATNWPSQELYQIGADDILKRNWQIATSEIQTAIDQNNELAPKMFEYAVLELIEIVADCSVKRSKEKRYDNAIYIPLATEIIEIRITIAEDKPEWKPWYYVQECQLNYDASKHQYRVLDERSIMTLPDLIDFVKERIKNPKDLSSFQRLKETT